MDLNKFPGVHVSIIQDEAGRAIYRARISLDAAVSQLHALDVVQQCEEIKEPVNYEAHPIVPR